jgi:hypothetical protein
VFVTARTPLPLAPMSRTVRVFHEPATGWAGTIAPHQRLAIPFPGTAPLAAISVQGHGSTITTVVEHRLSSNDAEECAAVGCPLRGQIDVYHQPAGARPAVLHPVQVRKLAPGWPLITALSQNTLLATTPFGGVAAYNPRRLLTPPTATLRAGGLAAGHPRLSITLTTPAGQAGVRTVALRLPAGLTPVAQRARLHHGIHVRPESFRATARRGVLTLTFEHPGYGDLTIRPVTVELTPTVVRETPAFRRRDRRAKQAHRRLRLTATATIVDGDANRLAVKIGN